MNCKWASSVDHISQGIMSTLHQWMHVPRCSTSHCPLRVADQPLPGSSIARQHISRGVDVLRSSREQQLWPNQSSSTSLAASSRSADGVPGKILSPGEHDEKHHNSLSREEVQRRVRKAANLMIAGDELAPFDRRTFNPALVLW